MGPSRRSFLACLTAASRLAGGASTKLQNKAYADQSRLEIGCRLETCPTPIRQLLHAGNSADRPNIVVFLADDLGSGDLGYRGAKDIGTPHIDRLAREGVQFTNAYSNGPVCSPTRAALLTGQYQQRHGVDGVIYVHERDRGLAPEAMTIAEVLKKHGYATGLMGKWHLGYPKANFPTRQGFDVFKGFVSGNIDYFQHVDRKRIDDLWDGEKPLKDPRYMTDLIGDESVRFIEANAQTPFFLYCAFNAPHDPFQGPNDQPKAGQEPFVEKRERSKYAQMVEAVDRQVGRVMDRLRKLNLERNTAVFFMSDNGGVRDVASNAPFRGWKGSLWEGGIRTPFVAYLPGRFPAGRRVDDPVAGMDILPTAADLTGARLPSGHRLDGVSLVKACEGTGGLQRERLFFHYQAPKRDPQYALREGHWKYLRDADGNEYLFDLEKDVAEAKDLKAVQPDRFNAMKRRYEVWRKEVVRS